MTTELTLQVPISLLFQKKDIDKGVFTLKSRKPSILIYGGDKNKVASQLNIIGQTVPIDGNGDLFAIAKLFNTNLLRSGPGGYVFNFSFGLDAAEAKNPASILTVDWNPEKLNISEQNAINSNVKEKTSEVKISVNDYDIYEATPGNVPQVLYLAQSILKILGSKNDPAQLSINQNQTQANAVLVIFQEDGTALGELDPSKSNQLYYLNQIAYVIPFIRPTKKIVFEIGDPEDDGEVEYEDE